MGQVLTLFVSLAVVAAIIGSIAAATSKSISEQGARLASGGGWGIVFSLIVIIASAYAGASHMMLIGFLGLLVSVGLVVYGWVFTEGTQAASKNA